MKICVKCVLPETFPGITFDDEGCCSYCRSYRGKDNQDRTRNRYKTRFLEIIGSLDPQSSYDALMAFSGGKDSTFTLMLLKERFKLKVLAVTLDHGFVSPAAMENIRNVTNRLDIDHLTIKPKGRTLWEVFVKSMRPDLYPLKALERASSICNSCMNLVKSFLLLTAVEKSVPLIAYGWSPGQAPISSSIFKTNASMLRRMQAVTRSAFETMVGDRLSGCFMDLSSFDAGAVPSERFPYLVHPLAFLEYNEMEILRSIRELGWVDPKDTDANSTNCLLNGFANQVHIQQFGFHPYAFEIAGLVREGYMAREEGLKRLSLPPNPDVVEVVRRKLQNA